MTPNPKNQLFRLRRQAGLTREKLSQLAGVSVRCITGAESGLRKTQAVKRQAILKVLKDPPFSMRCRWCGEKMAGITFCVATGQMTATRKTFRVFNGWFYHVECFDEKARADRLCPEPDDDLNKS